jgi:uncharacterized protein (DUF1778 family)
VAETKKKRRKPKAQRKEDSIRVRVTDGQKKALTEAAESAGLGVSSWVLSVALREAQAVAARRPARPRSSSTTPPADPKVG